MKKQVEEIRKALEARKEQQIAQESLVRFLVAKGVCRSLGDEIAKEFFASGREVPKLQESIVKRLYTAPPSPPPCSITLVGPTGIGKTTTVLKLVSLYTSQDLRVTILDLDQNLRLKQIATSWGIKYLSEYEESQDVDVLIVDTPGCNFYQPERVEELATLISMLPPTEILLTLSAATKDVDLYGAIHQFSSIEPTGLIFTKLDETLAGGVLLNVSQKTPYPLRYIAYGFPLPGKIEVADPKLIANKILTDLNCEEFGSLRQLIVE